MPQKEMFSHIGIHGNDLGRNKKEYRGLTLFIENQAKPSLTFPGLFLLMLQDRLL